MITTIENGLTVAWNEGAREVGVQPDEKTPAERVELQRIITNETNQIGGFADAIEAGSKANGGKLGPLMSRAEMWILRYTEVQNRGKMSAQADPKLEWVWDPRKEHCTSCERLNGKVKRRSFWQRIGVIPQNPPNPLLECGGWL
jgi:hypothetical protein